MDFGFLRHAAPMRLPAAISFCVAASLLSVAAGLPAANAKSPGAQTGEFKNALQGNARRTRFVVGLESDAQFQVFSLRDPNRVIIDLPAIRMQLPRAPGARPVGLVKSFRGGPSGPGKSRIVIDVTGPVVVENASIRRSRGGRGLHQLVLEIVPVAATTAAVAQTRRYANARRRKFFQANASFGFSRLGAANLQPPLPKRALSPSKARSRTYRPLIVIDPGHGGKDSGATKNGTVEKRVVLAFGKVLRDRLNATGRYRVLMTRDKDIFIPLGERVRIAERNKAALFIAVHADYAGASARGATIYSLRKSTADRLGRSASRQRPSNLLSGRERRAVARIDGGDVGTISNILADLVSRERLVTKDRTGVFARTVAEAMGQSTNMKNNPDKSAGFRVLRTAKVPSVLIELAYVTNRRDAAQLRSAAWRNKVAGSITTAVDDYFGSQIARLPM